jgi:hypothetical protein
MSTKLVCAHGIQASVPNDVRDVPRAATTDEPFR